MNNFIFYYFVTFYFTYFNKNKFYLIKNKRNKIKNRTIKN